MYGLPVLSLHLDYDIQLDDIREDDVRERWLALTNRNEHGFNQYSFFKQEIMPNMFLPFFRFTSKDWLSRNTKKHDIINTFYCSALVERRKASKKPKHQYHMMFCNNTPWQHCRELFSLMKVYDEE